MSESFEALLPAQKVDFFLHCQTLLTAHHPQSPFVFHTGNIEERLKHVQSFAQKYKGYYYQDDNVAVLYNKIIITDPAAPEYDLRAQMYKPPAEHFNAFSIDFVVFRDIKDCILFVQKFFVPAIQYVLFVRHGKVKLYKTVEFLQQILQLQSV